MMRLEFHGAAETVTGSKYLLEAEGGRLLVDCGLFQGLKELRLRNWAPTPFAADSVDAVLLTHAHIDHVGYLPRFVGDGFSGPVYCTQPTEQLAELLLLDSAKLQEDDAEYANRKGFSKHKPALPLYDTRDAKRALKRFRAVRRGEWFAVTGPFWARYHDTGHLLGACMIEVENRAGAKPSRILFSGDVGRYDAPLYFDPEKPPACDYFVCESTYGDRDHPSGDLLEQLRQTTQAAIDRGGVMLVASFAVGRAQQLIYLLQILIESKRLPVVPIYLDSPMAVSGMNIYRRYVAEHDLSEALREAPEYAFGLQYVRLAPTREDSKRINDVRGPAIIISSSGMMTGGRILHHLARRLGDSRNTIVLGGFMAQGTRGRTLQDGGKTLRMHGHDYPVEARVVELSGLSGHAGRKELLRWSAKLNPPRRTFVTHGEKSSAQAFAEELRRSRNWDVIVPTLGEGFELDAGD